MGALASASSQAATQGRWVIRDLGTLGGDESAASDINARGQVAGWASKANDGNGYARRAFHWQNGKMRDLGTLGGRESDAVDINEGGQVVGQADTKQKYGDDDWEVGWIPHAFLWQNGKMRDLGTLGGPASYAVAINDRGQVVGDARVKKWQDGHGVHHAFLWQKGKIHDLGSLGSYWSVPSDINERGQVVGHSGTSGGDRHAFLWENGKMSDLGTLPGRKSEAIAINERGQIVGEAFKGSKSGSSTRRAVLWTYKP